MNCHRFNHRCTPSFFFFFIPYIVYCSKESSEKKSSPSYPFYPPYFFTHFHICICSLYVFFFCPVNHDKQRRRSWNGRLEIPKTGKRKACPTRNRNFKKLSRLPMEVGKKHNGGGYINWLNNGFPLGSCSVVYPRGYEMHTCRSARYDRAGKESSLAAINKRWNALASRNRVTMHKFAPRRRRDGPTRHRLADTYPSRYL